VAPPEGDIEIVEAFYSARGRRPLVQVTPAEARIALDARLAARGWTEQRPTDVLVAPSDQVLARTTAGAVSLSEAVDPGWVAAWARCEERADAEAHAREVLRRIEPATAYAIADEGAGVGLAVCESGWAGLYCVATRADARRRGIAGALVHALVRWAGERGARGVYLQVERDNAPGQALYARLGFRRSHGYHYRLAPSGGG
jgi:ribosomal protein S18 acetylase RimI-like enzyme